MSDLDEQETRIVLAGIAMHAIISKAGVVKIQEISSAAFKVADTMIAEAERKSE